MTHLFHILILIVRNSLFCVDIEIIWSGYGPNQEMRQKWTVFYQYFISTLGFERFLFEERLNVLSKVLTKYS